MSKKQKRSVSGMSAGPRVVASVASDPSGATPARRFSSGTTEFNPDYTQVKAGLKRIGVLALAFISILIALSFILK